MHRSLLVLVLWLIFFVSIVAFGVTLLRSAPAV
jgi:hypothetical protein